MNIVVCIGQQPPGCPETGTSQKERAEGRGDGGDCGREAQERPFD